jgi:predicted O-methyltransferase YrrM
LTETTLQQQATVDAEHFAQMRAQSRIRELPLAQIFPGIDAVRVEIGAIDPDTKHANHVDMLYVCAIARCMGARRIFEFGTYLGRTTYYLALAENRPSVFTLDLDPTADRPKELKLGQAVRSVLDCYQGVFFRDTEVASRIVQLHGDSRRFDYSAWRGNIDFIFIDAGHTYEFVANDTEKAFQMLAPGGIVVWHDYAPKSRDVVRFARDLSRTRPLFWVRDTSLLVYIDGKDSLRHAAVVPPWAREKLKPG